jgi:putative flippase GtrA
MMVHQIWGGLALRWLKFNAVGAAGIVVQLALLALFAKGLGVNYLLATALAVEAAVIHNFFWHQRFTWADRASSGTRQTSGRFLRFNLANGGLSILGNLVLMRLLVGRFHLPLLVANLLAIAVCSLANFLASHLFVWRPNS